MPLMPKRTKHRKVQKGRMRGKATRGNKVTDGEYGIQAVTGALITGNQIEAARIAMTRYIKSLENPDLAPLIYCVASHCFWQDGKWIPLELYKTGPACLQEKSA